MTPRSLFALLALSSTDACTMYGVSRTASADGSTMVSHSDDGAGDSDSRLSYVPPARHKAGSMRDIYPTIDEYPKFIGDAFGKTFLPLPGQALTKPIGQIPQVEATHGYYLNGYAIQNDCELSFGESTASAVFRADAVGTPNGTALLAIEELSHLAAERVCTAREAVQLMGDLAVQYGFFGPDGGAGEMLVVGDPDEVFVFHILSDPTARSAIWAAQRVPEGEVMVAANHFVIREVDLDDADRFLGSPHMHRVALQHGLWDGRGKLDFTAAFSLGEYGNKYYSGRRMWDGFRRFAPSVALPPAYNSTDPWSGLKESRPYPFSVPPDAPLALTDLLAAHRSHYEGTSFDMTRGVAAGPFGSPDRYAVPGTPGDTKRGAWERSVAIYRAAFAWIAQAGGSADRGRKQDSAVVDRDSAAASGAVALQKLLPDPPPEETGALRRGDRGDGCGCRSKIWFGPADPATTVFVPLSVCAGPPPEQYTRGGPGKVDRESAYWAHRYTQNLAQVRYSAMIVDIRAHSLEWEEQGAALALQIGALQCGGGAPGQGQAASPPPDALQRLRGDSAPSLRRQIERHAAAVLASTWALTDDLVGKYADGGEAAPRAGFERRQAVAVSNLGYSSEWLAAAGFDSGPARIEGHIAAEATPGWLERQQLLGRTEPAVAAVALPAPSLRGADTEAQRQDAARAPQTLRVVAVLAFAAAVVAAAAVAAAVRRVAASTRAVLPLADSAEYQQVA